MTLGMACFIPTVPLVVHVGVQHRLVLARLQFCRGIRQQRVGHLSGARFDLPGRLGHSVGMYGMPAAGTPTEHGFYSS